MGLAMGHEAVVELLLKNGAYIESKSTSNGRTPLFHAVMSRHMTITKLLLGNGADMESKDASGETPRSYAAERGLTAILELIRHSQITRETLGDLLLSFDPI